MLIIFSVNSWKKTNRRQTVERTLFCVERRLICIERTLLCVELWGPKFIKNWSDSTSYLFCVIFGSYLRTRLTWSHHDMKWNYMGYMGYIISIDLSIQNKFRSIYTYVDHIYKCFELASSPALPPWQRNSFKLPSCGGWGWNSSPLQPPTAKSPLLMKILSCGASGSWWILGVPG